MGCGLWTVQLVSWPYELTRMCVLREQFLVILSGLEVAVLTVARMLLENSCG
jgi:hypothetical protein